MTPSKWRTTLVTVLTAAVFNFGVMSAAQAGIVSTGAIVSAERDADLASIRGQLQRADVQAQMQEMGVDAASVDARLATLSDSELRDMAEQMKNAPAGSPSRSTSRNAESAGRPPTVHRRSPSPSAAPASSARISRSARSQPPAVKPASA